MEPFTAKAPVIFKAIAGAFLKWFKPLRAGKSAAETPGKLKTIDQNVFDEVLRRIAVADPKDSIFTHAYDAATNKFFTPEFLRTRNVQDWLREPNVRSDLQLVASAKAQGTLIPHHAIERLNARYVGVACASLQEATPVVASITAMLAAELNARVQDTALAALVVGGIKENARNLEKVNAKLDAIIPEGLYEPPADVALTPLNIKTATVWREAFSAASRGLLHWPTTLGDGQYIARPELDQLLAATNSSECGTVALLGLPGSGKSALLARLGLGLAAKPNVSVLAIKGDLLDAAVATEEDLQHDLQLPELPSIMLRRLTLTGPVVLLVDQLDALAGHLDTKTGRLSALLNLIKCVCETNGLHVFVSCRAFEFTHDIRISRIDAECVSLELPSWEDVLPILEAENVKASGWNSDAREVVRVPQQLNTYLQLKSSGVVEPFSNYTAMLDCLWNSRVLNTSCGGKAANIAFQIAEIMADKETLWLAKARFDDRVEDINFLMSAGILTMSEQGAIGFSHQTVFEHVLARSFSKNDGQLSAYVLSRNYSLFVRPKLWAALAYLRNVEPVTYESELCSIWSSKGLRKHLRFLLIDFMGSQPSPTDKEELLLAEASEQQELNAIVLKAITGSQGWFVRFSSNIVSQAMSNSMTADICVQLLILAWPASPEQITRLLRDIWLPDPDNDRRALFVLQEAPLWNLELLEIAKTIARRAKLAEFSFDHFAAVVGDKEPKIAIELMGLILESELSRLKEESLHKQAIAPQEIFVNDEAEILWHIKHDPLRPIDSFLNDSHHWISLQELAADSPLDFVSVLWPIYISAFNALLELSRAEPPLLGYPLPYRADFRFDDEEKNGLAPSSILGAIVLAVEGLSNAKPKVLQQWVDAQVTEELAPVQRLVAHALAHDPPQTATAALNFILGDERRYFLGNTSDLSSTSLGLITKCAPHWSVDEVARFTTKVNAFSPPRPKEMDAEPTAIQRWHRIVRRTRFNLLRALPMQARTPEIQRIIEEGNRVYPQHSELERLVGECIGSPMNEDQMSRASNDDILNAIKAIPDKSGWNHPRDFSRGGNIQLARAFAEFSKGHPSRSLEVIEQLHPDFGQRAAGYCLETLSETYDPEALMTLILKLHERGFHDCQFRGSVAQAVSHLLRRGVTISEPVLVVLESWISATEKDTAPEDATNELTEDDTQNDSKNNRFLLSGDSTIELVPDGDYPIISAIVDARLARKEMTTAIQLLRRYIGLSRDRRVWEMLMHKIARIPSIDTHEGPALVGEVLSMSQLDGSLGAAILMSKAHWKVPNEVITNLRRWRDSKNVAARKGYGELVALIALTNSEAHQVKHWLEELVESPAFADARAGAAATTVQLLWPQPQFRSDATDLLHRLLQKNEEAIWHEIYGLFSLVDKLDSEPHTIRLLKCIAENIDHAPPPKESFVVERLGALLPRQAGIVARISSQLIQLWRDQLSNMETALNFAGQEIMDLAITLHRTEGTKLEGLQMFEQLIEIDAYQARAVLDELDHRIRPGARPLRRRQPRKARRRAR